MGPVILVSTQEGSIEIRQGKGNKAESKTVVMEALVELCDQPIRPLQLNGESHANTRLRL